MHLMHQPGSLVLAYCRVMLRWILSIGRVLWSLRVVCEGAGGGNIVVHGP